MKQLSQNEKFPNNRTEVEVEVEVEENYRFYKPARLLKYKKILHLVHS